MLAGGRLDAGIRLFHQGRLAEALAAFERLIALEPGDSEAHFNRGCVLHALARYDEALQSHDRALRADPRAAEAHVARGAALQKMCRYDEALSSYEAATRLNPKNANARFNTGLIKLLHGEYLLGWRLYEWRRRGKLGNQGPQRDLLWLGKGDLKGKRLLLHAEQGLGDTIQFVRYAPMAAARGAQVMLGVPASLVRVVQTLRAPVKVITQDADSPKFELHCPLPSLPLAFGTRLQTIPAAVPYLFAPPAARKRWRSKLPPGDKLRVGFAWAGSILHRDDHNRSIAVELLEPLLQSGAEAHCLLTEIRKSDVAALRRLPPIAMHTQALQDFSDTAALIEQMDLVISVDTAAAHLAGALGKPLWLLLPADPDFRWLRDRADSPWYPTARLFRQRRHGDWPEVIARVASELPAALVGALRWAREQSSGGG